MNCIAASRLQIETANLNCRRQPLPQSINQEHYFITETVLGVGGLGKVYKGYDLLTGQELAFKQMLKSLNIGHLSQQIYNREVKALRELEGSRNILKFKGEYRKKESSFIITELCNGGNLSQYIKRKCITKEKAIELMYKILLGYFQIYKHQLIHRDLKPSNILLTQNEQIRIADFGFAIKQEETDEIGDIKMGSANFMAPEVIKKNKYSYQSDIWALGLIFYELYFGSKLWQFKNQKRVYEAQFSKCKKSRHFADQINGFASIILKKTLCLNQSDRATPKELLSLFQRESSKFIVMPTFDFSDIEKIEKQIKMLTEFSAFLFALIDLLDQLRKEEKYVTEVKTWNRFLFFMQWQLNNLINIMRRIQENIKNLDSNKINNKMKNFLKQFSKIEAMINSNDKYYGKLLSNDPIETFIDEILEQFLKWLHSNITVKFPYKFFLLYDYLVTFTWIYNLKKDGIKKLSDSNIQIGSIVNSLLQNLKNSKLSPKRIKPEDLSLLEFKINSLKTMK